MEKGNPFALLVGMQTGAATMESIVKLPQKIKNGTALWPTDSTSGNVSEKTQTLIQKNIYTHLYIHCTVIYSSRDLETA